MEVWRNWRRRTRSEPFTVLDIQEAKPSLVNLFDAPQTKEECITFSDHKLEVRRQKAISRHEDGTRV
jgi:hypothetical protein